MVDESLEKFRLEYEKLHRALKKSHEQEKRLVKKCRELNAEILNNQAKIKTALRLSQEDQKTITHLQKEMEKTMKLVYLTQEKEARAKETIGQLKEEMVNLSKLVERGAGLSLSQENAMKELRQIKEELQRQLEEQTSTAIVLEGQLVTQNKVQEELRDDRDEANKLITELKDRLNIKESDCIREVKRREKTQKELQDARSRLEEKYKTEEHLRDEIKDGAATLTETEKQLSEAKSTMDKNLREYESLFAKAQKLTEDLESQVQQNKNILASQILIDKDLKLKNIEIGRLTTEKGVLERKVDKEHRASIHYQELLEQSKTPLLLAQNEIDSLKKELLGARRQELQLTKQTEKVTHEKEVQLKATERAETKAREQNDLFVEEQRAVNTLETELQAYKEDIHQLKKAILQLEKDRERLGNELSDQRSNYISSQEEIKLKDVTIADLKKQIYEWENKLKQQQQMYEAVRTDRNHYSKNLLESQDEIAELRKKFKIMGHQIDQLKEEICSKDQAIVKEHFEFQRAEKIRETIQSELNLKNKKIKDNLDLLNVQENELSNLTLTLKKLDEEALSQRKEYDQLINERDILGTQLIRRNDELSLLYEKLRIQNSALKKGEIQYLNRIDDIRILRIKLTDCMRENSLTNGNGAMIDDLKKEILQLQKDLLQEKTKVTALSEELENPMNVHRWRKLEGSDPATFELIQKIQTLQKRLITKTEEVVEKTLLIKEKEKLYNEIKQVLARQPGPEVAEQLSVYQQNLKKKTVQLKAMGSELNLYQAQANEFKYEVEKLSRELQEMKRKYYQQKRKEKIVEDLEFDGVNGRDRKSVV